MRLICYNMAAFFAVLTSSSANAASRYLSQLCLQHVFERQVVNTSVKYLLNSVVKHLHKTSLAYLQVILFLFLLNPIQCLLLRIDTKGIPASLRCQNTVLD